MSAQVPPRFVIFGAVCVAWLVAMELWPGTALRAATQAWFTTWAVQAATSLASWARQADDAPKGPAPTPVPAFRWLADLPGVARFGRIVGWLYAGQPGPRSWFDVDRGMARAAQTHTHTVCVLAVVTAVATVAGAWAFAACLCVCNVLLNLYPVALQQRNRQRVARVAQRRVHRRDASWHHRQDHALEPGQALGLQPRG